MGIAPYKTFTFDGESSADYGVYITGTGVFNAPERSVEMIEIAGRNGSFALDKGKFENIEVTYRVGIVDDSEADFADRVSDFRNWLCSKVGYCRLEDEYNPNEYRMGVYSSGVEIDHDLLIAGEAEITFNCKPQRWLTSGETAVSVADGGTLDNPTPFEAEPLLAVDGYGTIGFNGYEVVVNDVVLGNITLLGSQSYYTDNGNNGGTTTITIDESNLNVGDIITVNVEKMNFEIMVEQKYPYVINNVYASPRADENSDFSTTYGYSSNAGGTLTYKGYTTANVAFSSGTSATVTNDDQYPFYVRFNKSSPTPTQLVDLWLYLYQSIAYNATAHTITISWSGAVDSYSPSGGSAYVNSVSFRNILDKSRLGSIAAYSTKSTLNDTVYIDCDIGECYTIQGGEIVTLNNSVLLGSDLPKLSSGTNTFALDNTITQLEVTPRWWKV